MKSRTSFFNATAFRKNLTRFAPAWGLYTIGLLMCLVLMADSGVKHWLYSDIAESMGLMPLANLIYALLCAQLLFGDLYNTRMCNMLHAMPLRREGWFVTNVLSALVFSLIPTAVMTLGALVLSPFSEMIRAWQIPLYWFLGSNLQFLCFFGLAVFSAFCVGNRFAQAMVYGILNFASVIGYWLADTLYTPLVYGVRTNFDAFRLFSPVVYMADGSYIECQRILDQEIISPEGYHDYIYHGEFTLGTDWGYLWIWAAVGIALTAVALQLYRRRKLESAGDFMAIRHLEPVFMVVYTLVVGCVFQFVVDDMFGLTRMPLFLAVGLAVGWFTGRMLLDRTTRVFHKKSWLGFAAVAAAFGLSLAVTALDPLGIETWMPKAEEVASVRLLTSHGYYNRGDVTLKDPADIRTILDTHQEAVENRIDEIDWITVVENGEDPREMVPITLEYHLTNGETRYRDYYVWSAEGSGPALESIFSRVEAVFGTAAPTVEMMKEMGWGWYHDEIYKMMEDTDVDVQGLLEAVLADCEAGTMAQAYEFHRGHTELFSFSFFTDSLVDELGNPLMMHREIVIFSDNEHCVAWLEDMGVDVDAILARYGG